jgi:hypothetical protein
MNFVYLRSSRSHLFKFVPWFMHWHQGGERKVEKSCIASLEPIPTIKGELVHFFCIFGFWGGVVCYTKAVWPVFAQSWRFVPRVGTCSGGVCICAGGVLLCSGGLGSLLEHVLVSVVLSHFRYLRDPRVVFFKWSCVLPFFGFRSLVGVSRLLLT